MKEFRIKAARIKLSTDADDPANWFTLQLGKEGSMKLSALKAVDEHAIDKAGIAAQFVIGSIIDVKLMIKQLDSTHAAAKALAEELTSSTIADGTATPPNTPQTMTTSTSLNRISRMFDIDCDIKDMRNTASADDKTSRVTNLIVTPELELNFQPQYNEHALEFKSSDQTVGTITYEVATAS
jgi:hypothetical protein